MSTELDIPKWLESSKETVEIDTAQMTDEEFARFFRSERFEEVIKSSSSSASIGIPLVDQLFQFGSGTSESWTTWEKKRNDSSWRFHERTNARIRISKPSAAFLAILPELARIVADHEAVQVNDLSMTVTPGRDQVLVTLLYRPVVIHGLTAPAPTIQSISLEGFARIDHEVYEGQVLDSNAWTIALAWEAGATSGSIVVRTDRHSEAATVLRPASHALVRYRYVEKEEWAPAGTVSDRFWTTRGKGEHRSSDWHAQGWPKGDKDYLSTRDRGHITVAAGQRLASVKARVAGGNGGWTSHPRVEVAPDKRSATVSVVCWGPNAEIEIVGTVEQLRPVYGWSAMTREIDSDGEVSFSVPSVAEDVVLFFTRGGAVTSVAAGSSAEGATLIEAGTEAAGALRTYRYRVTG